LTNIPNTKPKTTSQNTLTTDFNIKNLSSSVYQTKTCKKHKPQCKKRKPERTPVQSLRILFHTHFSRIG